MARLIDADALRRAVLKDAGREHNAFALTSVASALKRFADLLDVAPTIDAAPVRRGEWVPDDDDDWGDPYCSECGCLIPRGPANFCPNCGADMRD